jgi:hypothetical protein
MKSREVFGLAIRISGLFCLLYLLTTGILFVGFAGSFFLLAKAVAILALSIWLLRGAPQLVRFAYRDND